MKRTTTVVIGAIVIVAVLAYAAYSWFKSRPTTTDNTNSDTNLTTETPTVEAACSFTVTIPTGYSVDDSSTCGKSYAKTADLAAPLLSIEKSDTGVTNLSSWVSSRIEQQGGTDLYSKPKAGSLANSLEVTATAADFANIDTYILVGSDVYDISMNASDASTKFTAAQLKMYHDFVATFKVR